MSKTVRLNHDELYDLGGKTYTLAELRTAVIEASMYNDLKEAIKRGRGL